MTEQDVRDLFLKNYDGNDLNEALMLCVEQMMLVTIRESVEKPEALPEIITSIAKARSRLSLFARMVEGTAPSVPVSYLTHFDLVRKTMIDVLTYARDNYENMNEWFKGKFDKEQLDLILNEMGFSLEKAAKMPANVRSFNTKELKLYEEFFGVMLAGIIGKEMFLKYGEEYNRLLNT